MGSTRIIITIPEEDKRWLEAYGKAHGISVSEAIRQAVRKVRQSEDVNTYRSIVAKTKGLWKRGDGLKYQRALRAEWERHC